MQNREEKIENIEFRMQNKEGRVLACRMYRHKIG